MLELEAAMDGIGAKRPGEILFRQMPASRDRIMRLLSRGRRRTRSGAWRFGRRHRAPLILPALFRQTARARRRKGLSFGRPDGQSERQVMRNLICGHGSDPSGKQEHEASGHGALAKMSRVTLPIWGAHAGIATSMTRK